MTARPAVRVAACALFVALSSCAARARPPVAPAPLAAPRVVPGDLDAKILLGDLPAEAARLGAGPLSVVASGEMVEGERIGAFVEVPPDVRLLAFARGSSSIEDLDAAAFADEGNPLAVDEGPDPRPTLLLCPPHPGRVYLAAHVASGEGLATLGAELVPRDKAQEIGQKFGARGPATEGARSAEAWPGLDDLVREHRGALGGTWQEFRRLAITVDARSPTSLNFPLEADHCVDALVVPDDDVALLDVEVTDADGRAIARGKEGSTTRSITVCSPLAVNGTLWIRPHAGRGLAAVVLARASGEVAKDLSARPEIVWVAPTSSLDLAKASRNALLAKGGYASATQTLGQLAMGRRATVTVDAAAGGCSRIDVVAGAPLALLDATVWEDPASIVVSDEGTDAVTLFACAASSKSGGAKANAPNKVHLDLETHGRPGPFAVLVRKEKWEDPAFTKHPIAAARMLARAAEGHAMLLEGAPVGAHAASIDATHFLVWDTPLDAGKCLRVAAGGEGEGTGLELRLSDATTGDELDRAHAASAVSARACASGSAPRTVHATLRATSGKLEVVVGERSSG